MSKKPILPNFGFTETIIDKEWQGMPEYNQNDLTSYKQIIVHFDCEEDIRAFEKLIGRKITTKTRSIWYPEAKIGHFADKRYVDES
jgi:hypothetical protein